MALDIVRTIRDEIDQRIQDLVRELLNERRTPSR
jgi:hypothetical protein